MVGVLITIQKLKQLLSRDVPEQESSSCIQLFLDLILLLCHIIMICHSLQTPVDSGVKSLPIKGAVSGKKW